MWFMWLHRRAGLHNLQRGLNMKEEKAALIFFGSFVIASIAGLALGQRLGFSADDGMTVGQIAWCITWAMQLFRRNMKKRSSHRRR
jgi:hypothetical protein